MVILNMDKRTMSEIRSYKNPPDVVHKVMAAALLMLGNDEKQTEVTIRKDLKFKTKEFLKISIIAKSVW